MSRNRYTPGTATGRMKSTSHSHEYESLDEFMARQYDRVVDRLRGVQRRADARRRERGRPVLQELSYRQDGICAENHMGPAALTLGQRDRDPGEF
jgi:hypothetical protein